MDSRTVSRGEATSVRQPRILLTSDSRYMTPLLVSNENKPCLELGAVYMDPNNQKIQDKIEAALKVVTLREQHVLVQFWSPHELGKHHLLTTRDQPFGVGVLDAGLSSYRLDSEERSFVVDTDHEKEDRSPAARVFRQGLPEWTFDLDNCSPKHLPQQECAIRSNLHGYLALPVFDSTAQLCVGVLELLTSSKYTSYAYEVQQLHKALEAVDLRAPQAFGCPALNVPNERRQTDHQKIQGILKAVCDIYSLLLAQTWAVSEHSSFVSHEKVIQKSCSSFDNRCVGKVCMTTTDLPFNVQDLSMWPFFKSCRERHLDRSCGLVGKALLTRGPCFCRDVTKLSEEEYPLVHNARMHRLTSCLAIFLRNVAANDDYVLEFFLPPDIQDSGHVLNLIQTLKQNIPIGSGFELADNSCIQIVGPPTDPSVNMESSVFTSSVSESSMANLRSPTRTDAGGKGKKCKIESVTGMVDIKPSGQASNLVQTLKQNFTIGSGFELGDNSCEQVIGLPTDLSANMECLDCVADNFTLSDSESSMANLSSSTNLSMEKTWATITDAGEEGKKHKTESVTEMVAAEIRFNDDMKIFHFPISLGLSYLKIEVSHRFNLNGKKLRLKYIDNEKELILIASDVDLVYAVDTTSINNSISLICLLD